MNSISKTLVLASALILALAGPIRAQDYAQDNEDAAQAPPEATPGTGPPPPTSNTPTGPISTITFQNFYDDLSPYGAWIKTDQYGYVFQPKESDPSWAPYTYGHWVNTQDGLTWESDEPFGWATYHYGRWVNLTNIGWAWVPGYTWGPAWVSWREGAEDVGWAPLPPESDQGIDYYDDSDYYGDDFGYHIGDDCDLVFGIGPWWYNFCPIAYIGDFDCWRHFHPRGDNFGFIHHTHNVTNINFRRDGAGRFSHVTAQGPSVAALNERARTPIATARLSSASRPGSAGLHGNSLAVFAPQVNPATMRTARPSSVSESVANTTVNRGTNINDPTAVNSRLAGTRPTSEQVRAATSARSTFNDRVATNDTRLARPMTRPITEMNTTASRNFATHEGFQTTTRATPAGTFPNFSAGSFGRTTNVYSLNNTPTFHGYSSSFHASEPSFHASQSFPSYTPHYYSAPVSHYNYSAPAVHYSGGFSGGFSGGRAGGFSGGGFSGGGHAAGGFGGGVGGHR